MNEDRATDQPRTELIDRLIANDVHAWREVVDEYAGLLHRVARRTFRQYGFQDGGQDVEDAVAEVWKNLVERDHRVLHRCRDRGNLLQTLHVLARNRAVDIMRKRKMKVSPLEEEHFLLKGAAEDAVLHFPKPLMREALDELNDRERTLVNLYFLQGKKYREIAELTGIPRNSIGATLCRALAKMRKRLAPHEEDLLPE